MTEQQTEESLEPHFQEFAEAIRKAFDVFQERTREFSPRIILDEEGSQITLETSREQYRMTISVNLVRPGQTSNGS